jgi:exosortase/archaeosortase family protein
MKTAGKIIAGDNATRMRFMIKTLARFFGSFLICYSLYFLIISASHPLGKLYSPFVQQYFNLVELIRSIILNGVKGLLYCFHLKTLQADNFNIKMLEGGKGLNLRNGCLAYGIMCFWAAFVYANRGAAWRKAIWIITGLAVITLLNITRIALLLVALNRNWLSFTAVDQHLLFNVVTYLFIFILIGIYSRFNQAARVSNI